uniref:V-type proton ATPase subunit n=1 Tax=Rhabditophanes sp. KR3021 TaxID=114890 RepID=A0AC35U3F4_9BILA
MGIFYVFLVTAFWAAFGLGLPRVVTKGPNSDLYTLFLQMTAVCCWMFWFLVYLHQINPLIGPQMPVSTMKWLAYSWGNAEKLV